MVIFHEPGVVAQMRMLDASDLGAKGLAQSLMTPVDVASDVWYLQSTRLPPSSGVSPRPDNSFRSAWPERAIMVKPDDNSSQICS